MSKASRGSWAVASVASFAPQAANVGSPSAAPAPKRDPIAAIDRVELRVLGPIEASVGGARLELGGPKQRSVLAVLAAYIGSTVSTERLIEAVHGQNPPSGARRSLQTFVSNLRRSLGDTVRRDRDGYRIDATMVTTDAADFAELYESALADTAPESIASTLRLGESLWRGAPYADVDGHTALDPEITRLTELRLSALELRIDAELALGADESLIGELETLAVAHPFRERFTCQLMVALYRAGRQAEALRACNRLRRHLVEELGIDPSEATRALEQRILEQDASLLVADTEPIRTVRGFELGAVIGEGRFAVVYEARQPSVRRAVAVKAIRSGYAHHPEFLRRFENEARLIAGLEHPHIVPIYEYWRDPDGAYIAMRLLRGGSLADALALGAWAGDRVARLIGQLAAAIAAAHRTGIIHRDIKPANVLLDEDGNGYLGDFGIAKIIGATHTLTDKGSPATPAYAAPEVLEGGEPGPGTDIYALAIVTYELLAGTHPYPTESVPALITHHLKAPLPALHVERPAVPTRVDEVLAKATAKNPALRYRDAAEFATELADAFGISSAPHPANGRRPHADVPRPTVADFVTDETPFGPIAMDEISTRDVYEALYDRDNRIHAEILRRRPSFIVGRRGAGKTALMRTPMLDPRNLLVEFKSADLFAHVLHCVETIESSGGRLFVKQVGDIWEGVVWSGLCLATLQSTTAPDEMRADMFTVQRFVAALGDPAGMTVDDIGAAYCRALAGASPEMIAGDGARLGEAKEACRSILDHRNVHAVVLIDSMEDLHTELDVLARPLAGLFGLIGRSDRSAVPDCDFRFCYPSELWMKLSDFAANPLKDAENHITLHWNAKELIKIAGNRLAIYLKLHHPGVLVDAFGKRAYNPRSFDDAKTVLLAVLPANLTNQLGADEDTMAYIMRHTQLVPRHLLRILNGIMRRNREVGGDPTSVTAEAVIEGVRQVEELLAAEIFSAYSAVHPYGREACRRAIPELSLSFTDGDLHRVYNRTGIAKTTGLEYFGFKEMLVEIGALGRVSRRTDRYVEAEFDYTLPSPMFTGHNDDLCLHPLFSRVFQARTTTARGDGAPKAVYPYGSDPAHADEW